MKIKLLSTAFAFVLLSFFAAGQVVVVDPPLPTAEEPVTVTLNTTGTGLESYDGNIYAHTGLTINDMVWQNVVGEWGQNETQPLLTKIGDNQYQFEITPSIREFYGADPDEDITQMSFVFRSSDGSQQTSPDIFYQVYKAELAVLITKPENTPVITQVNDNIVVEGNSTFADSNIIYIDNNRVFANSGSSFSYNFIVTNLGKSWITVEAKNDTGSVAESFYYFSRGEVVEEALPVGVKDGINYMNDTTVILSLYAPQKEYVFALGDFSNWEVGDDNYMKVDRDTDRFWLELTNLNPGEEYAYQYLVDGTIRISDPYTEKVLDPWNDPFIPEGTYPNLKPYPEGKTDGLVAVLQTNQEPYEWQVTDFDPPAVTDLVVYELLIRDFVGQKNFQAVIDTLPYLKDLGINAIEFMPINEFDGNLSWGYNPNHYFAVDKFYGTKNAFKELVDACHQEGIAVILDVVYNHATGVSPYCALYWDTDQNRPSEDSPFYNVVPKHDFNVFNDMNHESPATKEYISRAIQFWLEEFNIDGYRLDLSKGLTQKNTLGNVGLWGQYDETRINTLKAYADSAWAVNPDTYFILEHFAENNEEKELSNYGMMLWGNLNYNYNEATKGFNQGSNSDFSWISYQRRGWDDPHVLGYMESHDEDRLMFRNVDEGNNSQEYYSVRDTTIALQRQELVGNFFFTVPGPKLMWQFGERGYDYSIEYNGRLGEKPPRWDYMEDWRRRTLFYTWSTLIDMKKNMDIFETTDYDLDVRNAMKKIKLKDENMSMVILGNFDVVDGEIDPEFYSTGTWYDFWTGDSLEVTDVNAPVELKAGEYRMYTTQKLDTPDFVGIEETEIKGPVSDFVVYPNPVSTQMHLELHIKERTNLRINLIDLRGHMVQNIFSGSVPGGLRVVDTRINDVADGLYFVVIEADGQRLVKKLMVQ